MADKQNETEGGSSRGKPTQDDGGMHRHHHRHHHSRSSSGSKNRRGHDSRILAPVVLMLLFVVAISGFLVYNDYEQKKYYQVKSTNHKVVDTGYQRIRYNGKEYRYNSRITTLLYAGLDSTGEIKSKSIYRLSSRADSISLIVMDEYHKTMTIIGINRNTMTPIHRYTLYGHDRGEYVDHISLAFSNGENGDVSCSNLCNAVSKLLYGIPIKEYVVSNRSSLPEISRIIGDVTVVAPNDDMIEYGIKKGDKTVINENNIESFLRHRDRHKARSNIGRMERQKAFINAAVKQIVQLLKKSKMSVWHKIEKLEYCMKTNITRSRYIDLTNTIYDLAYEEQNYYTPEGEYTMGEEYEEFHVDEEALLKKVIEIFYIED